MSTPYDDILELARKLEARTMGYETFGDGETGIYPDDLSQKAATALRSLITDLEAANKTIAALRSTYCELETP